MIKFRKATNRNTECYEIHIGGLWLGILYETIVAVRHRGTHCRLANSWGPTTGRHLRELGADLSPVIDGKAIDKFIHDALMSESYAHITDRLVGTRTPELV